MMSLSITTLSIMTLSIVTLSIMTPSIITLSATTKVQMSADVFTSDTIILPTGSSTLTF